jgi:protein-tyrosine-phosphatase
MSKRILFVCARRSIRSLMAASVLTFQRQEQWEIWSTPASDSNAQTLARRVLEERGIPLLESPQITEPIPGAQWNEGIILCSGMVDT